MSVTTQLRILHVITKLDIGGAQSVVAELVREQIKSGHSVIVAAGVVWDSAEVPRIPGVRVVVIESLVHQPSPKRDRMAYQQLAELIRAEQVDIVHTHSSKGGLLGRMAARRCDVGSIYTAHGWPFQPDTPPLQQVQSFVGEWIGGRVGNEIVCVSRFEANLAAKVKVGRRNHRHVIYNGIGLTPPIHRSTRAVGDPFEILTIARFHRQKRVDLIIEAVAQLDDRARLTIVGDGDLRGSLESLVVKHSLSHRVQFVGLTNPAPFLRSADVFALASEWEGMPVTVLEAMRAGLPVIANDLPGNREAVGEGAGLLTGKSADELAQAMRTLMDDPARSSTIGAAARQRWETEFTATQCASAYESLYRQLLQRNSQAAGR